ncbi:Flp family type IVb pilin [Nocardioides ungokensis]|uniref:Flp family type IVb pilin n=1 Tax=Nocardioides ungokensis TaxID=1643322 RepID=UPI0015E033A0|nr:Flp family type IVb pilin [Nocardioides ungokensis]
MLNQVQINTLKFVYFLKAQIEAREERGATAVEYGLMVALIAVAIIVTVRALGVALNGMFQQVVAAL